MNRSPFFLRASSALHNSREEGNDRVRGVDTASRTLTRFCGGPLLASLPLAS